MTISEELFEQFCIRRRIPIRRVQETSVRTPDYEIAVEDIEIAVEVKQIEPNADDREIIDQLRRGKAATRYVNMGRARNSILAAIRQLRAHMNASPNLVVLFDNTGLGGYLDDDSIAQCLYGPEQIHFAVPHDATAEARMLGGSYGGGRIATDRHNTTLSAVAVLKLERGSDYLLLYHNAYAEKPIEPDRFQFDGVRHYEWFSYDPELMPGWVDVTK